MIIQFHLVEIFYSIFLNFKNIFNSTRSYERRTKVMKMLDKNPDINPAQLSSEDMADVDLVWSLVAMPSETNMPEEYAVSKLDGRVWCMSFWRLFKMKRVL